ncbi:MAG: hypothetical protein BWY83_01203 [bacterium ADurb.Bin478]|nr:MAG: hypothetical protein BWY83_01203 [bacterium ADurb.Bin478]
MTSKKKNGKKEEAISPEEIGNLTKKEVVSRLRENGSESITMKKLEMLIREGAPVNPDGTMNFTKLTAWLVQRYRKS